MQARPHGSDRNFEGFGDLLTAQAFYFRKQQDEALGLSFTLRPNSCLFGDSLRLFAAADFGPRSLLANPDFTFCAFAHFDSYHLAITDRHLGDKSAVQYTEWLDRNSPV